MSEVRTVKFNLKTFTQDYVFLKEENNKEELGLLEEGFNDFYIKCRSQVKRQVDRFFFKCPLVLDNPSLKAFLEKQGVDFQN
jgi:hypothetical protein